MHNTSQSDLWSSVLESSNHFYLENYNGMLLIILANLYVLSEAHRKTKDFRPAFHIWRQKLNRCKYVWILRQTLYHRTVNITICVIKETSIIYTEVHMVQVCLMASTKRYLLCQVGQLALGAARPSPFLARRP